MKQILSLLAISLIPMLAHSQFEQKISLNLTGGMFSTFGAKTYMPDYGTSAEDEQPLQISNYKPGVYTSLGIQYNLNRHFSIQADVGYMYTDDWFYDDYGGHNYTGWAIWDPVTDELLAEGFNELSLKNISIGLTPRLYLFPGKRLIPFFFGGLTVNATSTTYDDNAWQAYHDLDMLDPDDSGPERANIEKNTGIGFHPGMGLELVLNDRIGFHVSAGLFIVLLNEENFYVPEQNENLNSITIQAGLRFSFLKSKKI